MTSSIKAFSTSGIRPEASLTAWREYMSEVYYRLDIVPVQGDRIRGVLSEANVGSVCVSNFQADAQKVIRRKEAATIDGSENYVFLFPKRGPLTYRQREGHGTVVPGDVVILNSAEYYEADVLDGSENVTVKIPCDLLRPRLKGIDACCAKPQIANPHLVPIVSSFAYQLMSIEDHRTAACLQEVCLDLLTLMVETKRGSHRDVQQSSGLGEILFNNLKTFIRRHFNDPTIDIGRAADACRISIRYAQKLFQARGTTFGQELMEMRLKEADNLLRSGPGRSGQQIGDIAYLCGFSNQAHFAARYRKRFSVRPRDARNFVRV